MQDRTFSRREALRAGVFTLAGGATLLLGSSAAHAQSKEKERATWLLDPTGGGSSCRRRTKGEKPQGGCPACHACKQHAANKIFNSPDAANTHRAHKGCLCTIIDGPAVSPQVYDAVFVDGDSADRRDPRVTATLGGGAVDPVPVPMIAGIAAPVVLVAAGGIGYAIWRRNQRRLEAATVTAPAESVDRD